jgi:hypothetical protein
MAGSHSHQTLHDLRVRGRALDRSGARASTHFRFLWMQIACVPSHECAMPSSRGESKSRTLFHNLRPSLRVHSRRLPHTQPCTRRRLGAGLRLDSRVRASFSKSSGPVQLHHSPLLWRLCRKNSAHSSMGLCYASVAATAPSVDRRSRRYRAQRRWRPSPPAHLPQQLTTYMALE